MDKPPVQLNARKDLVRQLHFGEWVKVAAGSALHLLVIRNNQPDKQTLQTLAHGIAQWVTFPHRPTSEQLALLNVLRENSELGGRQRDGKSIFSPADHSSVRLDHLTFFWIPSPAAKQVTLILTDGKKRHKFWSATDVAGRSGRLDAGPAREALKSYRDGGSRGELALLLAGGDIAPETVQFSLLDRKSESSLEIELTECDRQDGLVRHLGRISVFTARKLYGEAVDEYEAALTEAPDSTSLLVAAILAEERIGNTPRGNALRKRLPPGAHGPGDP